MHERGDHFFLGKLRTENDVKVTEKEKVLRFIFMASFSSTLVETLVVRLKPCREETN